MKRILSVITAIFLIYGIFEIKTLMEDKSTISLLDKTFNKKQIKKSNLERRATIILKPSKEDKK